MPSVPMPIRGAKEPVDSRRPYLKPSTKEEKRRKAKARKRPKPKGEEKPAQEKKVRKETSGKSSPQDMVPGQMGTQNHQNTSQKRFQVKRGTFS